MMNTTKEIELAELLHEAEGLKVHQAFLFDLYKDARNKYESVKSRLLELTYDKAKEEK